MTRDVERRIRALLAERVGMRVDEGRTSRVTRYLAEGATSLGLTPAEYVARLEDDDEAFQWFVDRVTVQETSFFRDAAHFDMLRDTVLPAIDGPVTIWSAGCANGQEPYSLAMLLEELQRPGRVLATDISTDALARTRAGRYRDRELRGIGAGRRRHLRRDGDHWVVAPEIRARVEVVQHNIVTDEPPFGPGGCDVVFCRNVLIYLGADDVRRVLDRLATCLGDRGWLFVGGAETLFDVTDRFVPVRTADAFAFRVARRHTSPPPSRRPVRDDAPAARAPARRRPARPVPPPLPSASTALAEGRTASEEGDHLAAVASYRRATYLTPDDPLAHLHLGFALEAAGDGAGARRAYAAAKAALQRVGAASVADALEGYSPEALLELLDARLRDGGRR